MNSAEFSRDKPLKHLNQITERVPVNIEFQDLKYSVRDSNTKEGWRQILHSISGKFRCGELTAILGPSGAGKTTLLNLLAGYIKLEVQGNVKLNNRLVETSILNKISSYIMADNIIQPHLTLKEAMTYAAGFKLSADIKYRDKVAVVKEVIDLLGLEKCSNTFSERLSGGERKRLTIALELINNPPIIFLDEPTTGLDDFSVKQCVDLLKKISNLNRTVVCTIHQPPASLFQYFDQMYIIANGFCVYNGPPSHLVPFLSSFGYSCPSNYTPADFIIEVVHQEPSTINTLKEATENGKLNSKEPTDDISETTEINKCEMDFSASFGTQFSLLLSRMLLQTKRNRIGLYIQFFYHLLAGFAIAAIFSRIGNDASQTMSLLKFCICCIVFFTYTYVMIPILLFPLEVKVLQREYFNHWYSLKAYYSALTVSTLPLLVTLATIFSTIVYFLTDQPKETSRFIGFCLILVTTACTSQALGYLIGSIFSITKGSIVGSAVLIPLIMIALHDLDYKSEINQFYQILMMITFIRNGIVGLLNTLFYDRGPLNCEEAYCLYVRMDTMMKHVSIPVMDYKYQLGINLIFLMMFRLIGYLSLKCKLDMELSSKLHYYSRKFRKIKS